MVEMIQISDLHFGSREFREDYLLNTIEYIKENRPDIVVCTGDLTHKGKKEQYEQIAKYIHKIKLPMLNVIGNHDARNHGIVFFERFIGPRRRVITIKEKDTFIMGVLSPRDNTSEGELGDAQIDWINSKNLQKSLLFHQIRGKMNYIKPRTARIEHIVKSNIFS